ncbi:MAG TPA: DNA repair protein RecO [Kiritimatiellia bacterium]|nr:DNA repair protein RecO [Kiritimatiellia bacterium]HRU70223.1 DNA repair protein RecO [Kiritimatiellia bacterium]
MIIQTRAIVLHIRPWSQTSHMVTWLTPDYGRVVTAVKGACRPKSAFLGQYDLFYTCDLLFYRREHEGIHAIRECVPRDLREPLRRSWRHVVAASYLCDLTSRTVPGQQESDGLFALLSQTLDRLCHESETDLRALLLWYETHCLRQMGLLPDLRPCPHCHPDERKWLRFSLPSGRLVCPHVAQHQPGEATLPLPRGVRDLFLLLSGAPQFETAAQVLTAPKNDRQANLLLGLSRFLGMFMTFHLEVPSAVRRVTWEMLDTTPAQRPA